MLKQIAREDVPDFRTEAKSPLRVFARATLTESFESAAVGDVYEVDGIPEVDGADALRIADKAVNALRTELYHFGRRDDAKAFRRRDRVFIERVKKLEPIRIVRS